jgi:hypothetical protein
MAQVQGFLTCFAAGFLLTFIPLRFFAEPASERCRAVWFELAEQHPEEGGLPDAIGADDSDPFPPLDDHVRVLQHHAVVDPCLAPHDGDPVPGVERDSTAFTDARWYHSARNRAGDPT